MKLKRFAFFIQKVIILSFLATRTKKEQSFTRPSSLKKEVAKQYHHTMADYSYYTWVVSSKVGASRGRNIKLVIWNTQGRQKLCFSPTTVFFFIIILKSYVSLQRYLLTCQANSAVLGRIFALAAATLKGHVGFQNKKFSPSFLSQK